MRAIRAFLIILAMMVPAEAALADEYSETVELFRNAGESAALFTNSYGYAVFPTIGKAGLVVGGAHGTGRVYAHGKYVGDTSMTQVSVGIQAGGQAYSQIILFRTSGRSTNLPREISSSMPMWARSRLPLRQPAQPAPRAQA